MTMLCPQCHSKAFKRNGYTRHGKQNHRCLSCGKQFSLEPYNLQTNQEYESCTVITEAPVLDPCNL